MRGFMLDSARTLESRAYYQRFIAHTAAWGCDTLLWHFSDDQGCSLRWDSIPEAASPNAYAKDELRALLAHAAAHGVAVIPELETLGHTRFITRARPDLAELAENDHEFTALCPVHPRTRAVVGALLDEVCELFPAPLVHVGLDEVNFGDHPLTRAALVSRSRTDLFADHIAFLHERLARQGKRLMMWGDHLLKDPALAARVPKDILVANWQYAPLVPDESAITLQGHGFEIVSCPALISYDQPLYPGDAFALPNLRHTAAHVAAHRTLGTITTLWTPQRYLHDALWPALHLAADFMRLGPGLNVADSLRRFAASFFGMNAAADACERWGAALVRVIELSPLRKPWVAAMKLEMDDRLQGIDLSAQARAWSAVGDVLVDGRGAVRREQASYDALVLMAQVAAHVWDRAARRQAGTLDQATLDASAALASRLSAAWDAERFADDPRKYHPVFAFDADNHLLLTFEKGTAAARTCLGTQR
jgi:hypothetical protein